MTDEQAVEEREPDFHDLEVPVRPLNIGSFSKVEVTPIKDGKITAFLLGDSHVPYEDERTLSICGQIAEDLQPSVAVHMGDLLDCYKLSRFDKNPFLKHTLQDELNGGRRILGNIRRACPNSRFIYLEGNHEDRLRRLLWNLEGPAKALLELDVIRDVVTWPKLLGLDDLGIEFIPYDGNQAKQRILPKWILKHGNIVRQLAAYSARGELLKYGRSGSSGHTHRMGMHMRSDHNGNHCWIETGCTCDPEKVGEYVPGGSPDWQQGCVVLTFEPVTGAFQAEPVYIYNGLAVWREKVYRA